MATDLRAERKFNDWESKFPVTRNTQESSLQHGKLEPLTESVGKPQVEVLQKGTVGDRSKGSSFVWFIDGQSVGKQGCDRS